MSCGKSGNSSFREAKSRFHLCPDLIVSNWRTKVLDWLTACLGHFYFCENVAIDNRIFDIFIGIGRHRCRLVLGLFRPTITIMNLSFRVDIWWIWERFRQMMQRGLWIYLQLVARTLFNRVPWSILRFVKSTRAAAS